MESFPSDFGIIAERKEFREAQVLLAPKMREILLPEAEKPYEHILVEYAGPNNVVPLLGGHRHDEAEARIQCGFHGWVRPDRNWRMPVKDTRFCLLQEETERVLSGFRECHRIAVVQGAYTLRYSQLLSLFEEQKCCGHYETMASLAERIEALDDACSQAIRRIVLGE